MGVVTCRHMAAVSPMPLLPCQLNHMLVVPVAGVAVLCELQAVYCAITVIQPCTHMLLTYACQGGIHYAFCYLLLVLRDFSQQPPLLLALYCHLLQALSSIHTNPAAALAAVPVAAVPVLYRSVRGSEEVTPAEQEEVGQ